MNKLKNIQGDKISLSKSQLLLWMGQQLSNFSPLYNMAFSYQFFNPIKEIEFQSAFQKLVDISDAMRSCFIEENGNPIQVIQDKLSYSLEVLDFSTEEDPHQYFNDWKKKQVQIPFNIEEILFDSKLIKLDEQKYIWYLNQHHLITDAWSITIQYQRFIALYKHTFTPVNNLEEKAPLFSNYLKYEFEKRTQIKDSLSLYWQTKVDTLPEIPALYSKHNTINNTFIRRSFLKLNAEKVSKLRELIKSNKLRTWSEDLSFFIFFLTILYLITYKLSGQASLTIGTPVHNRNRPDFKNTIGVFIELFPIHIVIDHTDSFLTLFNKVRDEYYQFMRYTQVGYSSAGLSKKFNVVLNYINTAFSLEESLPMKSEWINSGHADPGHYLKLQIFDFDNSGELNLTFDGNSSIFTPDQMNDLPSMFSEIFNESIGDFDLPVSSLSKGDLLTVQQFNSAQVSYPEKETIVSLFEKMVAKNPSNIAAEYDNSEITFRELDKKSNQVAHRLQEMGVAYQDLVAICLDRSINMMIGLLGILKAGAAYVPIDPTYPIQRINDTINQAQIKTVVCQNAYAHFFDITSLNVLALDKDNQKVAVQPTDKISVPLTPKDLMYVIYTSGSTGKPKGVMNQHDGVVNRLLWAQDYFSVIDNNHVILQKTTFCFDVSVWELFLPLISGTKLSLSRSGGQKDSSYLIELIARKKISMIHFVPPMLEVFLLDINVGDCLTLKHVVCSGEALKPHQVQMFKEKLPHVKLYNLYGPTEAAIDVTAYEIPDTFIDNANVTIGKPIANTQIYILNELNLPCTVGVAGELFIGGVQVARGYFNQEELTTERFVEVGFLTGEKLYKTGDLAAWRSDGNIDFLGRLDAQVKIRGFRVETAEIESVINTIEEIAQSVVLAKMDHFGNNYLVGYFVSRKNIETTVILNYLKEKLPAYMVPTYLVSLKELPLTINGKIDRKAFPDPVDNIPSSISYTEPRNEFEEIIQEAWEEVFQINQISIFADFLAIGGESLSAIRLVSRLKSIFEIDLPLNIVFNKPNIAEQAASIESIILKLLVESEKNTN